MDESRLLRTAWTALSSMLMASLAWTISIGSPKAEG
jgi:hypothetical protein